MKKVIIIFSLLICILSVLLGITIYKLDQVESMAVNLKTDIYIAKNELNENVKDTAKLGKEYNNLLTKYNNAIDELSNLQISFSSNISSLKKIYDAQIKELSELIEVYRGKLISLGVLHADDFEIYSINGIKYVNFGSYPQTHINDQIMINKLNGLTLTNARGYYELQGKQYAKISATPNSYGPQSNYVYSTGEKLVYHKSEWFEVEPIKWRILEVTDGEYMLLSEMILDVSMYYHDINSNRTVDNKRIYANNYEYSDIRYFLNNDFYNGAFTKSDKTFIVKSIIDNSANTTFESSNIYACSDTNDNVFILSYQDIVNTSYLFSTEYDTDDFYRVAKVTDYAKARGIYYNNSYELKDTGYWWLRSPSYYVDYRVDAITSSGKASYIYDTDDDEIGVRPSIILRF